MRIYEKSITVTADDLDELQHVNNVRYLQWIQDISKEHWELLAPDHVREEVVWVVMNHNISYKRAAFLGDELLMKTYIEGNKGATSIRRVEILKRENTQLLVESKTEWCLLNAKTQRPIRISETIKTLFIPPER